MSQFPNPIDFLVVESSISPMNIRFRLPFGATISKLKDAVAKSVGFEKAHEIELKFVDEEGDFCVLSSEGDLQEAIRLASRDGLSVRLVVSACSPSVAESFDTDSTNPNQPKSQVERESPLTRQESKTIAESSAKEAESEPETEKSATILDHTNDSQTETDSMFGSTRTKSVFGSGKEGVKENDSTNETQTGTDTIFGPTQTHSLFGSRSTNATQTETRSIFGGSPTNATQSGTDSLFGSRSTNATQTETRSIFGGSPTSDNSIFPQKTPNSIFGNGRYETRTDRKGRTYYIDHLMKTTSWEPPILDAKQAPLVSNVKATVTTDIESKSTSEPEEPMKKSEVTLEAIAALLDERLAPRSQKLNLQIQVPGPQGSGGTLSVPYTIDIAKAIEEQNQSGVVNVDVCKVLSSKSKPGDRTVVVDLSLQDAVAQQIQNGHVQVHLNSLMSGLDQHYRGHQGQEGAQYHRRGDTTHAYISASEWAKLSPSERAAYDRVATAGAPPVTAQESCAHAKEKVHPNITCDACEAPLVGMRYHRIGKDYDLCAASFERLPAEEHQEYECIIEPGACPEPVGLQNALSLPQDDTHTMSQPISKDDLCSARLAIQRQKDDFAQNGEIKASDTASMVSDQSSGVKIHVGPSDSNVVEVQLPCEGLKVNATPINPQDASWQDTFSCEIEGRCLRVIRIDEDIGWDQDLCLWGAFSSESDSSSPCLSWDATGVQVKSETEIETRSQELNAVDPRLMSETCSEASEFLVLEAAQGLDGDFVMVPASQTSPTTGSGACPEIDDGCNIDSIEPENIRTQVVNAVFSQGFTDENAISAAYESVDRKFMEDSGLIREAADIHRSKAIPIAAAIAKVRVQYMLKILQKQDSIEKDHSIQCKQAEVEPWSVLKDTEEPSINDIDLEFNAMAKSVEKVADEISKESRVDEQHDPACTTIAIAEDVTATQCEDCGKVEPLIDCVNDKANQNDEAELASQNDTPQSVAEPPQSTTVRPLPAKPTVVRPPPVIPPLSKCDRIVYNQLVQMGFGDPSVIHAQVTSVGDLSEREKAEARRISHTQHEPVECVEARMKLTMLLDSFM